MKRFKRLPPGSERHWGHVVDARVGPGLKSMTKFKKRKEESLQQQQKQEQKVKDTKVNQSVEGETTHRIGSAQRFCKIFKKNKKKKTNGESLLGAGGGGGGGGGGGSHGSSDDVSSPSSPLSYGSDGEESAVKARKRAAMGSFDNLKTFVTNEFTNGYREESSGNTIGRRTLMRKNYCPVKNRKGKLEGVLEEIREDGMWTKVQMCCGPVYENKDLSAIIVDVTNMKICGNHQAITTATTSRKIPMNLGALTIKKHHHHMFSSSTKVRGGNLMDFTTMTQPKAVDVMKCNQLSCPTLAPSAGALGKLKGSDGIGGKVAKVKEYNFVKNIVKICNETKTPTSKVKTLEKILSATENLGNKFSDNSSDSGYEELPNIVETKNPMIAAVRNSVMQNSMIIGMNQIALPQTQPISSTVSQLN